VVADDSLKPSVTEANQEVARGVRQRFGFKVCYAGPEERRALLNSFLSAGLDPEVVGPERLGSRQ